jgi:hypothetical protein
MKRAKILRFKVEPRKLFGSASLKMKGPTRIKFFEYMLMKSWILSDFMAD